MGPAQDCGTPESSPLHNTSNSKFTIDCRSCVRESLSHLQLPDDVMQVAMSSWRRGTQKQYHTYITKLVDFCHQGQINYYKPGLNNALQFLHTLYELNLSYSTINTPRSALSTIIKMEGSETFRTHPVVSRYLKGIFLNRKPVPKYNCVWDVIKVLRYLKTLALNSKIPLKDLTLKLVMLLSLVTAQRG